MGAVWFRFRVELRSRWRAWLVLGVLVGIAGGVVIAAAAGARRTDTAYDRFLESQRASDVVVVQGYCPDAADLAPGARPFECDPAAVAMLPQVAQALDLTVFEADLRTVDGRSLQPEEELEGVGDVTTIASADGGLGTEMNRWKIVEGRRPDPGRPDEVLIGLDTARRLDLHPGDELRARFFRFNDASEVSRRLTIVGVEVAPFEVRPPSGEYLTIVHLTPAFHRRAVEEGFYSFAATAVRLTPGASVEDLEAALKRHRFAAGLAYVQSDQAAAVQRGISPQAAALAILAALVALAAVAVFGQILVRQTALESAEHPLLGALGFSRRGLFGLGMARAAVVALVAAAVAALTGFLLSPFTPIGLARTVEPHPGLSVDGPALALGVVATLLVVLVVVAVPAWRLARVPATGSAAPVARARPSVVAGALARASFSPPAVTGVRMALEPGRGRSAVPVRTTLVSVTLGVVALVAALTFSASLTHLLRTPRLSGWNWDAVYGLPDAGREEPHDPNEDQVVASTLAADRDVAGFALGTVGQVFPDHTLELDGLPVGLVTFDAGPIAPTILDGRAPAAPDEIAVGRETLDQLGLDIGDSVETRGQVGDLGPRAYEKTSARMQIVGTVVLPTLNDDTRTAGRLGRGAAMTLDGLRTLNPVAGPTAAFFRVVPGADSRRVVRGIERSLGVAAEGDGSGVAVFELPSDLVNVRQVDELPLVLAGLVGLIAAATLAHVLVSSVRARRRDLALVKTLGFVRRQVRGTVAWQASTVVGVALLIGVPLGVVAGRWAWRLFADRLSVVPEPVTPWLGLAVAVPVALVLANLIASVPAWFAARTPPAVVLRSE